MTFQEALQAGRRDAAHCEDAALMAAFCEGPLQRLVGAVGPRLVWEGARRKGLTTAELAALAHADPGAVHELMWTTGEQ